MAKKPAAKASKKAVKKASKPAKKAAPKKVVKKPVAKKVSKAPMKKAAMKKPAPKKKTTAKKPASKPSAKKAPAKKVAVKAVPKKSVKAVKAVKASTSKAKGKPKIVANSNARVLAQQFIQKPKINKNLKLTPFLAKQHKRLLELKDTLLDAMRGVARDNLHSGSETSAFGMHQADAGSDAYDRDFALSMLSKEQSSLYEIDEALKRIEDGNYGICEISEKPIPHARLEALPFTRYTVDCQAELEKRQHHNSSRPQITSLFGLTEEEAEGEEEENTES